MASVSKLELMNAALTATTNGATKALELYQTDFMGWLEVSAINGATTAAVKIQHSSDGTNWVDLITFASLVGVTGFEAKAPTTSLLTFVRAVVTLSGATQTATVKVYLHYDKMK